MRSWDATVDKASRLCDPVSLALEPMSHLSSRDSASAEALDPAREVSTSSAYGSELSTKMTARQINNHISSTSLVDAPFLGTSSHTLSLSKVFLYE